MQNRLKKSPLCCIIEYIKRYLKIADLVRKVAGGGRMRLNMTNSESLGNKLYELRKKNGLSQEAFADRLGVSRQAVSKWECGESLPDTDNLITISKLFGVSLDELVGNSTEKEYDVAVSSAKHTERDRESVNCRMKKTAMKILTVLPYPVLVTVAFLLWGFLADGWTVAWTLFVTIPVYESLIDCIRKRRFSPFAYPVFITFVYLFIGMKWGLWHPYWVLYITIPIYYSVADALDRK